MARREKGKPTPPRSGDNVRGALCPKSESKKSNEQLLAMEAFARRRNTYLESQREVVPGTIQKDVRMAAAVGGQVWITLPLSVDGPGDGCGLRDGFMVQYRSAIG